MKTTTILVSVYTILCFSHPVFSQGWECEECPKRNIGLFDLDVWVENPAAKDSSITGQIAYQNWVELFMVASGVHEVLFNEDPSKECLTYFDGQMSVLLDWDQGDYTHGNNQASLPPAPGMTDRVDYWITGVIAKQKADGLTIIKVYVQASGTGETAAEASALYDYNISGIENGKRVAQQLLPLMDKIRDFEKRKRDEEERIAIGPYENATLELKPEKERIETGETVEFTVKLLDCDDVPLKNMEVRLEARGGTFDPDEVTTDDAGKATTEFTADNTPGRYRQPFEFEFRYPFANEFYTSGDDGYISIVPIENDAVLTISKTYNRTLKTNREDARKEHTSKRDLNEKIDASATVYLNLIETQDMPISNQTWEYYQPTYVDASSFSYNYRETKNSAGPNYQTDIEIIRNKTTNKIEGEEYMSSFPPWVLVIDNETEKAVKLIPAGYGIEYEYHEIENMTSVSQSSNGSKKESETTIRDGTKSFKLGPVGEEISDPTIKSSNTWIQDYIKDQGVEIPAGVPIPNVSNQETVKKIQPDILVKYGDGKTSFGGDGNRNIKKDLEDGYEEQDFHYNWSMTVKKKK